MNCSNKLIKEVFALTRKMITIADKGNVAAKDDGCRLLYSVLVDCAYKVKAEAQRELEAHQKAGKIRYSTTNTTKKE